MGRRQMQPDRSHDNLHPQYSRLVHVQRRKLRRRLRGPGRSQLDDGPYLRRDHVAQLPPGPGERRSHGRLGAQRFQQHRPRRLASCLDPLGRRAHHAHAIKARHLPATRFPRWQASWPAPGFAFPLAAPWLTAKSAARPRSFPGRCNRSGDSRRLSILRLRTTGVASLSPVLRRLSAFGSFVYGDPLQSASSGFQRLACRVLYRVSGRTKHSSQGEPGHGPEIYVDA